MHLTFSDSSGWAIVFESQLEAERAVDALTEMMHERDEVFTHIKNKELCITEGKEDA